MSPIQKAEELIKTFIEFTPAKEAYEYPYAIDCALKAVKEIQQFGNSLDIREPMMYWNSVESELNKMKDATGN